MGECPGNSCGVPDPRRFRRLWRTLDLPRRGRLTELAAGGRPAEDPLDASLVAGLARRMRRQFAGLLFIVPPLTVGLMLGLIALVNRSAHPAAHIPLGWPMVLVVILVLFVEAVFLAAWIRARRVEIVNTPIAQGKPAPDEPLTPILSRLERGLSRFEQLPRAETRRRGHWHCPRCGRLIPKERAPPTTAIGGHWLQPPEEELLAACKQGHQIRPRRR